MNEDNINWELFLKEHWFKVGILLIGLFIAWTTYNALVVQPQEALKAEQNAKLAEIAKEEDREENLSICLEESEYQKTTDHLALCGDPNVGKSPSSCFSVYGSTKSYSEVANNYEEEFPDTLPEFPEDGSYEAILEIAKQRREIISEYWDSCNCGLTKSRRDGLDADREVRDNICIQKYGG